MSRLEASLAAFLFVGVILLVSPTGSHAGHCPSPEERLAPNAPPPPDPPFAEETFGTNPVAIPIPEGTLFLPENLGEEEHGVQRSLRSSFHGSQPAGTPVEQLKDDEGSTTSGGGSSTRGGSSRPRRVVINYAQGCCSISQRRNCITALMFGADMCVALNASAVSPFFARRNAPTLSLPRGGGYWLWKPFVIFSTLMRLDEGDLLLYSDAAQDFVDDVGPLFDEAMGEQSVMLGWGQWYRNRQYCKRDTYLLTGCTEYLCVRNKQLQASLIVFRKDEAGLGLVAKWLAYSQDPRALTDMDNTLGQPDHKHFRGHRHDQAVLTMIAIKENISAMDAYFGNEPRKGETWIKLEFNCTVWHHRIRR